MELCSLYVPGVQWRWYVFGKDPAGQHLLLVQTTIKVPLWRRLLTRVLLGSVWERQELDPAQPNNDSPVL